MYPALEVANWFICNVDRESGASITHLKLQKLLYYAQAWTKVLLNKQLFFERIEAWTHGPVIIDVYHKFKEHSWHELPLPDDCPEFDDETEEVLNEVLRVYGKFDAKYLEELTHQEEPWLNARGDLPLEARCETEITIETMETFYRAMYQSN